MSDVNRRSLRVKPAEAPGRLLSRRSAFALLRPRYRDAHLSRSRFLSPLAGLHLAQHLIVRCPVVDAPRR